MDEALFHIYARFWEIPFVRRRKPDTQNGEARNPGLNTRLARRANHPPKISFWAELRYAARVRDAHDSEAMLAAVMNCRICDPCSIVCPTAPVMIQACGWPL